jgi:hypothetical protein
MTSEQLAARFHEAYERLAPSHGYETRKQSAVPWDSVPEQNKRLMIAVCAELLPVVAAEERQACAKVIEQAKKVCRWVGWMRVGKTTGCQEVIELKKAIEELTGQEIEEYT